MSLPIHEHMSALADATRSRMLLILEQHELQVTELCTVLQLPQSTVSRHLKTLVDDAWVVSRREGTSRLYSMEAGDPDAAAQRLWALVKEQCATLPASVQDAERLKRVLALRTTKSQAFFASTAGQWDKVREELFGGNFHLQALLSLLGNDLVIGDLGCGTGQVTEALSSVAARIIAIDDSPEMLTAARHRLTDVKNVALKRGKLEALPVEDGVLDVATLVLVLHHLPAPEQAVAEAYRVLRPGGRLLVVDMMPHDRKGYRQEMGHVWLGFTQDQIHNYADAAGFQNIRYQPLPHEPSVRGPGLFTAVAQRPLPPSPDGVEQRP